MFVASNLAIKWAKTKPLSLINVNNDGREFSNLKNEIGEGEDGGETGELASEGGFVLWEEVGFQGIEVLVCLGKWVMGW